MKKKASKKATNKVEKKVTKKASKKATNKVEKKVTKKAENGAGKKFSSEKVINREAAIIKILQRFAQRRTFEHKPFESSSIGDLAFLLLIYFIVTSSFIMRQGIFFSLPAPNAGAIKMKENQIVEVYPKNDGFLYGGNHINRKQFSAIIKKHRAQDKDKVLVIKMGENVRYDRLVDTLSVARESGMSRVSLKNLFGEGTR